LNAVQSLFSPLSAATLYAGIRHYAITSKLGDLQSADAGSGVELPSGACALLNLSVNFSTR
jgi:hypothetical protein